MKDQVNRELIKAFAYGKTAEEVAEVRGITLEDAKVFQKENEKAIADKRAELKEAGYIG